MNHVTFIDVETFNEIKTYAIVDHGNGQFTSMLKNVWDELQIQQQQITQL